MRVNYQLSSTISTVITIINVALLAIIYYHIAIIDGFITIINHHSLFMTNHHEHIILNGYAFTIIHQ